MSFTTADLYDENEGRVQVALPLFADFGGVLDFSGPMATLKVFEDNTLVRDILEQPGEGRVLVVDGGESMRCALVGDKLAQLGVDNGWTGMVISGCIRDSGAIAGMPIGIKAMGTNPRKSVKKGVGDRGIPLVFAGVTFTPGEFLYADADGILLSNEKLV